MKRVIRRGGWGRCSFYKWICISGLIFVASVAVLTYYAFHDGKLDNYLHKALGNKTLVRGERSEVST